MDKNEPLTIVCWKWKPLPGTYRTSKKPHPFTAGHVNVLLAMLKRYVHIPFRLVCVTDDPIGISDEVTIIPLWDSHREKGGCFTRLRVFDRNFDLFGKRFVSIDLDCVIVDDITPLLTRKEDFVIWAKYPRNKSTGDAAYCGGMWMMDAGCRPEVWESFDVESFTPNRRGRFPRGTDQAQINSVLSNEATWMAEDGVINFTRDLYSKKIQSLPRGTRIVFFNGRYMQDESHVMNGHPWIKQHYYLEEPGDVEPPEKYDHDLPEIDIVLFWWGLWPLGNDGRLGRQYIRKMVRSLKRYLPSKYKFNVILFTDRPRDKFPKWITVRELDAPRSLRWNLKKMFMFSEKAKLTNPVIAFDLDCVLAGPLDELVDFVREDRHILYTCEGAYTKGQAGGSIVAFAPNKTLTNRLWNPILKRQRQVEQATRGSERMYYRQVFEDGEIMFWENFCPGVVASFKRDCKRELPSGVRVVRFHGKPRPHEVADINWVKMHWR